MPSKQQLIRSLGHARRRTFEAFGSYRFSRTGAEDIGVDSVLGERYLEVDRFTPTGVLYAAQP
jgi:hypothetical protein